MLLDLYLILLERTQKLLYWNLKEILNDGSYNVDTSEENSTLIVTREGSDYDGILDAD